MMRSISSVLVGETKEIECFRPREIKTTLLVPVKEHLPWRLLRKLLRKPAPMKTVPWTRTEWDKVGGTIWVVGTEDGPRVEGPLGGA